MHTPLPPSDVLLDLKLTSPTLIAETAIASIWKVQRAGGQTAALKIYHSGHMGNESAGFAFLRSLNGVASTLIYETTDSAAVMEWLEGPSLGDLARHGQDTQAAAELVAVANRIHSAPQVQPTTLPQLKDWFKALFRAEFAPQCPPLDQQKILKCQDLAQNLLSGQRDMRPLHGDLHHDNIRLGERGYSAFDAKGIIGERAYELANAFRHPSGAPDLVHDPARIRFLCRVWSEQLCIEPQRLMQWAAVKSALSIVWRGAGVVTSDPEFDLLDLFLSISEE